MKKIFSIFLLLFTALAFTLSAQTRIYTPQLESPEDMQIGLNPDVILSWQAVTGGNTGVIEYEVQLDTDPGFGNPTLFETEFVTGIQMSELTFGQTYFWRVRAKDGNEISDWSESRSFVTLKRPVITKPNDASEESPEPLLQWNEVTGITFYDYQFDTVYFWKDMSGYADNDLNAITALADTLVWMVGNGGAVYFYNGDSVVEQETPTSDDLFAVAFIDVNHGWAAGEDGTVIYFDGTEWTEQSSATSEDINGLSFVDASNGWGVATGGEIVYFNGTEWASGGSSGTSDDLFDVDFIDASNGWAVGEDATVLYYNGSDWTLQETGSTRDLFAVRMISANMGWAAGKSGVIFQFDGTEWMQFSHSLTTKDIYSLAYTDPMSVWASGKDGTLLFYDGTEWTKPTSGTDLDLNGLFAADYFAGMVGEDGVTVVNTGEGFNSPLAVIKSVDGAETSLQMKDMCFGTTFFWRMRVRHNQDTSAWSSPLSFYTVAAPELNKPNNGSTDEPLNLLLQWRRVSDNVAYELNIDDDPEFGSPIEILTDDIEAEAELLQYGVEYNWRVKAVHTKDESDWSEVRQFTTINTVELVSPSNGATDQEIVPVLEWEGIGGTLDYHIQLSTTSDFSDVIVDELVEQNGDMTSLIVPMVLERATEYFWRVRAQITIDTTQWSDVWSFTTVPPVGIDEMDTEAFFIYPNPASEVIYIQAGQGITEPFQISISDILGKEMIRKEIVPGNNNLAGIQVGSLTRGLYLIRVENGNHPFVQKLIIR